MPQIQLNVLDYSQDWQRVLQAYRSGQITDQEHKEEIADLRMIYGEQENRAFCRSENTPINVAHH